MPKTDSNGFPWVYDLTAAEKLSDFKKELEKYDKATNKGNITWWIELEKRPIGIGRTRTKLNADLINSGAGNIGLGLISSERGKGYGEIALQRLIIELQRRGVQKIMAGVYEDNFPSRKIIENNGGIQIDTVEKDGKTIVRYWI